MLRYALGVFCLWLAVFKAAEAEIDVVLLVDSDSSYRDNPLFDYIKHYINFFVEELDKELKKECQLELHLFATSVSPVIGQFESCQDVNSIQEQVNESVALFDAETNINKALTIVQQFIHDEGENTRNIILITNGGATEANLNEAIATADNFKEENDRSFIYVIAIGVDDTEEAKLKETSSGDYYFTSVANETDLNQAAAGRLAEKIGTPLTTTTTPTTTRKSSIEKPSGAGLATWCAFLTGLVVVLCILIL